MNRQQVGIIYNLARLGLIAFVQNPENTPGIIAQHAHELDQWRSGVEEAIAAENRKGPEGKP